MILDAIVSLGSLIVPPAFDFVKKKFIKGEADTPERTMGSLATTKPEVLPGYVKSMAELKEAQAKFFNRDVIGEPSQIVVDLRAAIRPLTVLIGLGLIGAEMFTDMKLDEGSRLFLEANISNWFGSRLAKKS
jgi:hypothetical protein